MMGTFNVLLRVALRNLFASWMNVTIGIIIFGGTVLVLVGSSIVDSVDFAMSRSIIGSAAGHLHAYSAESKDEVAVFGQMAGEADLAPIDDFAKLKQIVGSVENVDAVVPMGINGALITSGNTFDLALEKLRALYRDGKPTAPALASRADSLKRHIRHMVQLTQQNLKNVQEVATEKAIEPETLAALAQATSPTFWSHFDVDPLGSLEFLENKIAPLGADSDLLYLHYAGTDLQQFQQSFDRMRIVDGTIVPEGHRGLLLSKFFYEEGLKLKAARRLDKIKEAITEKHQKISDDSDLKRLVKENQSQTKEILFQLDELSTKEAVARLQRALSVDEADLGKLLAVLFATTDENFAQRYEIFYTQLAPLLDLYRLRIGDSLTIKSFTRSGYVRSANLKLYGTFEFNGLEHSPLAGGLSLMDLASFRELYGYLTADKLGEIEQLKKEAGATLLERDSAEATLFGAPQAANEAHPKVTEQKRPTEVPVPRKREKRPSDDTYSKTELDQGVVLSSAIMLKDAGKLDETMKRIQSAADKSGMKLKVVSWQKASGLIGQFVVVAKLVLYFAVLIIFVVMLVIMNNALMMATLQRVQEIGTLRAMGAQRGFVMALVVLETLLLALLFGAAGTLAGSGIMAALAHYGIPATSDVLYFFFSGPKLLPVMHAKNVLAAFGVVTLVSIVSTLYPAFLATRVPPVRAMQTEE